MVILDLKANAYNMAYPYNQADIVDMAREFERDLIIEGITPLSIIRQRKAEKMKLLEQKDSSRHNRDSEGKNLYEKGTGAPPFPLLLTYFFHPSDVREIEYSRNQVSITSGIEKKTYEIETNKRGKTVGIRFKNKTFVEK